MDILSDDEGGVLRTLRRNEEVLAAALASRSRSKWSEDESENASRGGSSKGSGSTGGLGSFDREVMNRMSGVDLNESGKGYEGVDGLEGLLRTVREREVLGVGPRRGLKGKGNERNGTERYEKGSQKDEEMEVGSAESDSGLWMLGARKEASKHNANTATPNLGMSLLSRGLQGLEIEGQNPESDSDDRSMISSGSETPTLTKTGMRGHGTGRIRTAKRSIALTCLSLRGRRGRRRRERGNVRRRRTAKAVRRLKSVRVRGRVAMGMRSSARRAYIRLCLKSSNEGLERRLKLFFAGYGSLELMRSAFN